MPVTPVNVGSAPNDNTGDPLRTAFTKLNTNDQGLDTVAAAALTTAWAGTSVANAAYELAQKGTVSHQTLSFASTISFDMTGSAYQSCTVTGNTSISVINQVAPTNSHIQVITGRLVSDGAGTHTLAWDSFGTFSTPPTSLPNNKAVLASFTSYGTSINNVYLVTATQS